MTKDELLDNLLPIITNKNFNNEQLSEKVAEVFGDFLLTHPLYCRKGHLDQIFDEFNAVMAFILSQPRH